jgi:hypothetical protein
MWVKWIDFVNRFPLFRCHYKDGVQLRTTHNAIALLVPSNWYERINPETADPWKIAVLPPEEAEPFDCSDRGIVDEGTFMYEMTFSRAEKAWQEGHTAKRELWF